MPADRVPGEIVALVQSADETGHYRLTAVVATRNGAQVGVLVAPPNGNAGAVGFEPVPALADGIAPEQLEQIAESIPPERTGVDPNDPRGIRKTPRRAGMLG